MITLLNNISDEEKDTLVRQVEKEYRNWKAQRNDLNVVIPFSKKSSAQPSPLLKPKMKKIVWAPNSRGKY